MSSSQRWFHFLPLLSHALSVLYRSGFDGTARLWDSVTGDCLKVLTDHTRAVYALSFCPDGMWLATGSGDGWVHVYDIEVISILMR
jgi:transducin (beta)-like 1